MNDQVGKSATVIGRMPPLDERTATGDVEDIGTGRFRIGDFTGDLADEQIPDEFELRQEAAEHGALAIVLSRDQGREVEIRIEDRSPRVWNLNEVAARMRTGEDTGRSPAKSKKGLARAL